MISNIQALRGFAALNVVFFHALGTSIAHGDAPAFLLPLAGWGASGVDVFFVISGFIMAHTQEGRKRSWQGFALNRIARITPLYWIITALALARIATTDPLYIASSLGFVSMHLGFEHPVLSVGWTLEYEMLFYALFAAGIAIGAPILFAVTMITALAITGVIDWVALEFCMGMGCYLAYRHFRDRENNVWIWVHLTGWALLFLSVAGDAGLHRVLLWGVPSSIIVLSALLIPQTKNRLLSALGHASYGIYLIHLFVLSALFRIFDGPVVIALSVIATAVIGYGVWRFVEMPVTATVSRLFRDKGQAPKATTSAEA